MANMTIWRLARAIRTAPTTFNEPNSPPIPLFGTVTAIQTLASGGTTVTLTVGASGGTVENAACLTSYTPTVGDTVYYHQVAGTPVVLGAIALV
jgi:hypothetical protein